jgi:predicted DNA binding CopG/RHH family protein
MKKKFPIFRTDEEAEQFVETADLTEYDFSQFKRVNLFEYAPKSAQLNMRVSQELLDAYKKQAKARGIPYTRLVREVMEAGLASPSRGKPKAAARKRGVKRSRRVAKT